MTIPSASSTPLINSRNFFYFINAVHLFILQNCLNLFHDLNKLTLKNFIKITFNMSYYPLIFCTRYFSNNLLIFPHFILSRYRIHYQREIAGNGR